MTLVQASDLIFNYRVELMQSDWATGSRLLFAYANNLLIAILFSLNLLVTLRVFHPEHNPNSLKSQ